MSGYEKIIDGTEWKNLRILKKVQDGFLEENQMSWGAG
jgi:hypothetical protein